MRVLQLISSEGFYGSESMLIALSRSLERAGCRVVVGAFRDAHNPHIEVAEAASEAGLETVLIDCRGRFHLKAVGTIRRAIVEKAVDVVHCHGYKADLYGRAACWGANAAIVSTCHNWPSPMLRMRAYAVLDRLALRSFDQVTTPSPHVAEVLKKSGIKPDKLSCINNGVEMDRFADAPPTLRAELRPGHGPVIGFVGRMVPEKGGDLLLLAALKIFDRRPAAMFVFIGEGPSRKDWAGLASRLGIADRVMFTGARKDMPGVYSSLDIVVLPSLREAMPMCLLEALASEKPVIASRVGAVPDLIVPGFSGVLVKPGDPEAIATAIVAMIENPEEAARLARNGRHLAQCNHSSHAVARRYLSIYERGVRKGRRRVACEASR